jgi:hypothetical protein
LFIWAALRSWPADLLHGAETRLAVATAKKVQNAAFGGGDAAYLVVVRGMTKDNLPASWRDLGAASASIDERLQAAGLSQYTPPAELLEMWDDFRNGAFSLVDAGDRPGMPPLRLGDGRLGILRFADDCVPAPDRRFAELPPQVAARVEIETVQVGDVLGTQLLHERLDHLGRV